jgi:hypothetical protein
MWHSFDVIIIVAKTLIVREKMQIGDWIGEKGDEWVESHKHDLKLVNSNILNYGFDAH